VNDESYDDYVYEVEGVYMFIYAVSDAECVAFGLKALATDIR